jgi:hypothetical protein
MNGEAPRNSVTRFVPLALLLGLALASAPTAPGYLAKKPSPVASPSLCQGTYCLRDSDCYAACPGGVGSSYCDRRQHECYPY